jgi:hypothetical protein
MNLKNVSLLASVGFVALLSLAQTNAALAATAPTLGTTSPYGVVSSTLTNANFPGPPVLTNVTGSVCGTTLNIPLPSIITGSTDTPCAAQVGLDQGKALAILVGQAIPSTCTDISALLPLDAVVIGANPAGTFPPGCYFSSGAMNLTLSKTMTLNGPGIYIFRPGGALNTGANSQVVLANGACASDVYWAPVGATTIGAYTIGGIPPVLPTFQGNILDDAGITMGNFAYLTGRALSFGGTVTLAANRIDVPTCAPFTAGIPTLSEWGVIMLVALLALLGFVAIRRMT